MDQSYIRVLTTLRTELSREIDRVQVGEPPSSALLLACRDEFTEEWLAARKRALADQE